MNTTYSELKKQRQFMAKFVITVILMHLFCIFALYANTTEDWEICGCNPPTYSLSFTGNPDYYAAGPEKTEYFPGEKVMLGYSNENVLDGYWVISPSSHLASGSRDTLVEIYMTDSTEASYFSAVSGLTRTITITNTCPACGDVNPVGVQDVPYGEIIQITASPFGEKIPVWHGKPTNQAVDGGTQRLSEDKEDGNYYLNFHATGNYTLRCEWEFPPTGELRTGSISWIGNGNAMIHTAGYESSHFSPSPFLHNSATTTHSTFDARCIPDPGCYLTHWQWNVSGVTKYRAGTALVSGSYYTLGEITLQQPQTDFVADVQQGIFLNIVTEGKGVVTSDCFQSSWNPKPYYVSENGTVLNELVSGNEVIMEATACPGWGFHHWEVDGSVVETDPVNPYQGALQIFMNWWQGAGRHVPYGNTTLEVKAVFLGCDDDCSDECNDLFGWCYGGNGKPISICKIGEATPKPTNIFDPNITGIYNCIAWSVGIQDKFIDPVWYGSDEDYERVRHWYLAVDQDYGNGDDDCSMEEWDAFFDAHDFERCEIEGECEAAIGFIPGDNGHAYNLWYCSPVWSSKCGYSILITHEDTWLDPSCLFNYGEPLFYYRRK